MTKYLIGLCFSVAIYFLMSSFYLVAKAHLAQVLLMHTWQEVLNSEQNELSLSSGSPWPWADFHPVAKLTFVGFNVSQVVLNTDSGQALAFGPGLTAANMVNKNGVTVISGHNDSHFKILAQLKVGDELTLTTRQASRQYFRIDNVQVIDTRETQLSIYNNRGGVREGESNQELVLVTCYPFDALTNTTPYRLVVLATAKSGTI